MRRSCLIMNECCENASAVMLKQEQIPVPSAQTPGNAARDVMVPPWDRNSEMFRPKPVGGV